MKITIETLLNIIDEEVSEDILNSDTFEEKTRDLLQRVKETEDGYFEISKSEIISLGLDESAEEKITKEILKIQNDIEGGLVERDPFDLYVSYR